METCFNYCDLAAGFFSSDERKWINKVRKLKEEHPNEVEIIKQPEDNDGCIYAKLPTAWFKLRPPVKRDFTEEQLQEMRERMKTLAAARKE